MNLEFRMEKSELRPQHRVWGYIKRQPTTVPWANKLDSGCGGSFALLDNITIRGRVVGSFNVA